MAAKLAVFGIMDLVVDMAIDTKREMRPNAFGIPFYSFLYLGLFFFALILNFWDSHILRLGGRSVKSRCAILHLVKPDFLHLG